MAAGFAASFVSYARQYGIDREVLLSDAGVREHDLADQDNRIPVVAYQSLIANATGQTGDTALLRRHPLETELSTMSVVGQFVHSSASLRHSIEQLNRYLRLIADVDLPLGQDRFELL